MLTLDSIKIKNFQFWENSLQQQFIGDSNIGVESKVETLIEKQEGVECLEISKKVSIEGHYVNAFAQLREADGISPCAILQSLDPETNSNNVF